MSVSTTKDNRNCINTKEELTELLKRYKGILANPMIDYLNSLIELEFSVIRENIGAADREALSELEVYKRIAIYNIYNRALKLLNENGPQYKFSVQKGGLFGDTFSIALDDNRKVSVFNFDYKDSLNKNKIPVGYKTMKIGTVSLYQTLENKELREAELNRVMNKLETLRNEKNPYPPRRGRRGTSTIGGPGPQWAFGHAQEIAEYEKKFTELNSKKELNDIDKREIEITNQFRNLFLEDYGLTNESFEEGKTKSPYWHSKANCQKTLIKKQTNLTILNHINYI